MEFQNFAVPDYLETIKPLRQKRNGVIRIVGVDSETREGSPITFQFYGDDCPDNGLMVWTKSKTATRDFFKAVTSIIKNARHVETVIFCHNNAFDFVSFFHDRHTWFRDEEFDFNCFGWNVSGVYASIVFATLTKGRQTIHMIDTHAYFPSTLASLAKIFCPNLPKLKKPKGLGQKLFKKSDKEFIKYAMRDSEIAYFVGKYIIDMHNEYGVSICVSLPQMAAKIFRCKYLKEPIPLPPKNIVYASLHAYHGGKNNMACTPGWYKNVYSYDIISAYPAAMAKLPSFSKQNLYKRFKASRNLKKVPNYGVYLISGHTDLCNWPIIFDHKFKPVYGNFRNIWVTGFEINEGLRIKELKLKTIRGVYYEVEKDKTASPFKAYIQDFFKKKSKAKEKTAKTFFKRALNSLYGKFIQTTDHEGLKNWRDILFDVENEDLESNRYLVAGGLFNPFIAALITGSVRADMHRMEHKIRGLHSATDGIFTQIKPKESKGLGGWEVDCFGELLLLRNKCYIIYGNKKQAIKHGGKLMQSKQYPNKYIMKYAHHGFYGNVFDMEKMQAKNEHKYKYIKVNKLKESLSRGLTVNKFEERLASFNYLKPKQKGELHNVR